MADKENHFQGIVDSLLKGMDSVLAAKTVVGEPTQVGDITLIPLVDISFGVGAGAGNNNQKGSASGAGGLGGKMTPSAVLMIKNGTTRLINIKNQDSMNKFLDMIPEIVDRFTTKKEDTLSDSDAVDIAFPDEKAEE